ncbi:hypothetical protein VTO73DRAFT_10740 [Trametes versicolor]
MQPTNLPDDGFLSSYSVCGIYQVTHLLGEGSEGDVVRAFNINTGDEVAIKTTPRLNLSYRPTVLEYEAKIHALIPNGTEGFPSVHYAGPDANDYVIVMDRLGPTLNDLHRVCRRIFTLPTICMLADQMLDRVQFLHSRGVVSCDVKPHNFAMGLGNNMDIVHMFDYSSARPYLCLPDMSEHIPFSSTGRHAIGTVRYASLAAHKSHSVSRADDIESLLYVLLEFYHGRLPWQDIPAPSSMKYELVYELKTTVIDALLARSPPEFAAYRAHVAGLAYGEEPNYALLRGLFRDRMAQEGWAYDWVYDWMDARKLPKGTLLPEEYKASFEFVEDKEYNPHIM